jgi:hypothetical protein
MLHLFIMDNSQVPAPENFNSYNDLFPDIIPLEDRKGSCISCEFKATEYYRWSYFRVSGQNANHDERVYFAGRFDYNKFPQTEDFVEKVLDPLINFELLMARRAMQVRLINRLDRGSDRLYTYGGDTTPLNDAISRSFRKQHINLVT